jgi:hypothetical protein
VAGLYRGIGPTLLRAMPANGGVFLVYEIMSHFFSDKFDLHVTE